MKIKINLLFIILLIISGSTFEKLKANELDSLTRKGIKQIYSIDFTGAENTFRKIIADYPEHPSGRFFLAMIDWWKILLDLDVESYDDIFFQKIEDVIYQCDQILKREPQNVDALFFKGGAIGFRGRLRAVRESWLKAADDGREALPIVQRASRIDPDNKDVELGFGIYNYYAAVIPDRYPLIKPLMLFFPKGDKAKGISQLRNTAFNGKYANYEARYFLMSLYFQFENDAYAAEEFARLLHEDFPDNPVFERWRGRIAVRRGEMVFADSIFRNVYNKCKLNYPGYNEKGEREAVYYLGYNFKDNRQIDSAKFYFHRCEELSLSMDKKEQSGFLVNAVLYLGMLYDESGDRGKAVDYYNRVLNMRDFSGSRKWAESYLKNPYIR
jgi:tetratricopeptide (TPR) repeat protein